MDFGTKLFQLLDTRLLSYVTYPDDLQTYNHVIQELEFVNGMAAIAIETMAEES